MNLFSDQSSIPLVTFLLFIWSIIWKGLALWRAGRDNQRNWFVAILILSTAGILEIIYLFRFAKKRMTVEDLQFWKYISFK